MYTEKMKQIKALIAKASAEITAKTEELKSALNTEDLEKARALRVDIDALKSQKEASHPTRHGRANRSSGGDHDTSHLLQLLPYTNPPLHRERDAQVFHRVDRCNAPREKHLCPCVVLANLLHRHLGHIVTMQNSIVFLCRLVDIDRIDRRRRIIQHVALEIAEIDEDRRNEKHLVIVVVDNLTHIRIFERVADVVRDHVHRFDDLDVTEILPYIRCERMERVARTRNLDTVAVHLIDETELSLADAVVDVLVDLAVVDLIQLVVRRRAVKGKPREDTHDARRVLSRGVGEVFGD